MSSCQFTTQGALVSQSQKFLVYHTDTGT